MNSRIATIVEGVKNIASACVPVLREYKVSYFKKTWNEDIKMYDSKWTEVIVMAYNREHAAQQVDPSLRPGYNCWATRQMGGKK